VHRAREPLGEKGVCWLYLRTEALSGIPDNGGIRERTADSCANV